MISLWFNWFSLSQSKASSSALSRAGKESAKANKLINSTLLLRTRDLRCGKERDPAWNSLSTKGTRLTPLRRRSWIEELEGVKNEVIEIALTGGSFPVMAIQWICMLSTWPPIHLPKFSSKATRAFSPPPKVRTRSFKFETGWWLGISMSQSSSSSQRSNPNPSRLGHLVASSNHAWLEWKWIFPGSTSWWYL